MSAMTSVPTALYKDKKLKDFDIRLYLIIAENVNEYGYSKIHNDTLSYLTGKDERTIQRSLERLIERGWLKTKFDVKQNNIYDQACKRVIWLEEFYRKHNYRTRRAKEKNKTNDFNKFVAWLKSDLKGVPFPVTIGGLLQKYIIKTNEKGKALLHVERDGELIPIDKHDSKDVYLKLFRNKGVIIERAQQMEDTRAHENIMQLAKNKKV